MTRTRSVAWLLCLGFASAAVVYIASGVGIVQFRYPRAVENDPLLRPVKVQSVAGDTILLEDGRAIQLTTLDESIEQSINESGYYVDVEPMFGRSCVVYIKRRGWICGTPWTGLIEVPLIPDDVPINRREVIGHGVIVPRELPARAEGGDLDNQADHSLVDS